MTKRKWIIIIILASVVSVSTLFLLLNVGKRKIVSDLLDENNYPAIKIIVQNGSGFSGVANNVKDNLFGKNIEVVGVGNARKFVYDETIIIVKHGDNIDLKRIQNMTGIENVIYAVNENYFVPFIIVAGRDYQKYFN